MQNNTILNDRYFLESTLGSGGMAVVYRARDQRLERNVAIKLLREDYSQDPGFRARFHQEAKAAANLTHPNIVTVHDFGIDKGHLYIVMEYVPGTDMYTLLQKQGRFRISEGINFLRQACAGVGYAHRAGLVHCDIKPHNFLITPDNRLKVTDFGIARALETIRPDESSDIVWGSPQYFSPEQASGKPPTPASDVYSLGIIFYYMLTGRLPFTASTASELARMHRHAIPPKPSQINNQISPSLEAILLKILAKEPSQRYRTADQLGRVITIIEQSLDKPENNSTLTAANQAKQRLANETDPSPIDKQPVPKLSASQDNKPIGTVDYRQRRKPLTQKGTSDQVRIQPLYNADPSSSPFDLDWITIGLGLLSVITVGGLIPLWIWVYFTYYQIP